MGMIDRYKKAGGFFQLVALLESCPQPKRDKFLEIVRSESTIWADAVQARIITIDKFYSWPPEVIGEVFLHLNDITAAIALSEKDEAFRLVALRFVPNIRRKNIEHLIERPKPSAGELATAHFKIVETVRKTVNEGFIRFETFAPELTFSDRIEAELEEKIKKSA